MADQLSLRDFLQVEEALYASPAHGWRAWDGRWKLAAAALAMISNVLFAKAWLSGCLLAVAGLGMVYSRCSWRHVLIFLLAPAWATLALVIGMAFGFGVHAWAHVGPFTLYYEGLLMGLNAGLRVATDVAWAGLLVITTPFVDILEALRWYHLPKALLDTLSYMYRYVFLLYDEFLTMRNTAQTRGGLSGFKESSTTMGRIAAQIFLRAYDRAERISQAVRARGGD